MTGRATGQATGQATGPTTRFRTSKFVIAIPGEGGVALCHAAALQRLTVTPDLAEAFELFRDGATLAELAEACGDADTAARLLELFANHGLIVAEALDEDAAWRDRLGLASPPAAAIAVHQGRRFDRAVPVARGDLAAAAAPLRVALIGGCFVEVLREFVVREALRRGFHAEVAYGWPETPASIRRQAGAPVEFAILHPFVRTLIEPVWGAYGVGTDDLEARIASLIAAVELQVAALAEGLAGRLGLVHNLTAPQISPRGRYDQGFAAIVARVNAALVAACAPHANLVVIDEEAAAASVGKHRVLDDLHAAFSHHGHGHTGQHAAPRWADAERSAAFLGELARAQLDAYDAWRGHGRIKCVVVDLDNTLWPGVLGDEGLELGRMPNFEGIHEALALLKARGVLLATCSKNDEAATMASWRQLGAPLLAPEAFVAHQINWRRKSDNLVALSRALGVALDAMLFVDDSPLEREEVRRALPEVHVWDGEVYDLRHDLLTDPRLDVLVVTAEAARRTEMMQAQLAREALRAAAGAAEPDLARSSQDTERAFLRGLAIELAVAPAAPADAPRLGELFQRTNQFNTSLLRYTSAEVGAAIARGAVWTLAVRDRFTDHGLVGAIVLRDDELETLVLSCRVIGLSCAVPFLATVLTASGLAAHRPRARVVVGPRNEPARGVFLEAGFTAEPPGEEDAPASPRRFTLRAAADLAAVDPELYRVTLAAPGAALFPPARVAPVHEAR